MEHQVASTGQYFMGVGLVANIPYQTVMGRVVDIMQGNGQLDGSQASTEMAAAFPNTVKQVGTQFICELGQLLRFQFAEMKGLIDGVQQRGIRTNQWYVIKGLWHARSILGKGCNLTPKSRVKRPHLTEVSSPVR